MLVVGLLFAHGGRQRFASSIAVDAVHRTGPHIASLHDVAIVSLEHRIFAHELQPYLFSSLIEMFYLSVRCVVILGCQSVEGDRKYTQEQQRSFLLLPKCMSDRLVLRTVGASHLPLMLYWNVCLLHPPCGNPHEVLGHLDIAIHKLLVY